MKRRFLPKEHQKSIYKIDFKKLYDDGKRLVLTDLDNTLVCYNTHHAHSKLKDLILEIKNIGFEIKILSNTTNKSRVETFSKELEVEAYGNGKKPFTKKMKRLSSNYKDSEVIMIGDQMLTDVWAGNKCKFHTILINPINQITDKVYTKFNRKIEKRYKNKYVKKGWLKLNE